MESSQHIYVYLAWFLFVVVCSFIGCAIIWCLDWWDENRLRRKGWFNDKKN